MITGLNPTIFKSVIVSGGILVLYGDLKKIFEKNGPNYLSNVNIIFEKYKQGEEFFNPRPFHENFDSEKYFELLIDWKSKNEQYHLINKQYLRRP